MVKRFDRGAAELGGGDGEDARAGSDVQKGLFLAGPAAAGELLQAKEGGGVMAGAEAQSRVQNHHPLAPARPAPAPGGLDEEEAANFDGFEMPFPRFGPVLAGQWFDGDFCRSKIQPAILKRPQSAAQMGAHGLNRPGHPLRVDGDVARARRLVAINRGRLLEMPLQKTGDGLFSLGRGGNRDLPHRAMKSEE